LALAVGMALSEVPRSERTRNPQGTEGKQQGTLETPPVPPGVAFPQQPSHSQALPSVPKRFSNTVEGALIRLLREHGGRIAAGQRTLGRTLGVSATHINRVLAKMSNAGIISLDASRRGSEVTLLVRGNYLATLLSLCITPSLWPPQARPAKLSSPHTGTFSWCSEWWSCRV
jgi:hypothetical protein